MWAVTSPCHSQDSQSPHASVISQNRIIKEQVTGSSLSYFGEGYRDNRNKSHNPHGRTVHPPVNARANTYTSVYCHNIDCGGTVHICEMELMIAHLIPWEVLFSCIVSLFDFCIVHISLHPPTDCQVHLLSIYYTSVGTNLNRNLFPNSHSAVGFCFFKRRV